MYGNNSFFFYFSNRKKRRERIPPVSINTHSTAHRLASQNSQRDDKFDVSRILHSQTSEQPRASQLQTANRTHGMKNRRRNTQEQREPESSCSKKKLRHNGIWPKALFDVPQIISHWAAVCYAIVNVVWYCYYLTIILNCNMLFGYNNWLMERMCFFAALNYQMRNDALHIHSPVRIHWMNNKYANFLVIIPSSFSHCLHILIFPAFIRFVFFRIRSWLKTFYTEFLKNNNESRVFDF